LSSSLFESTIILDTSFCQSTIVFSIPSIRPSKSFRNISDVSSSHSTKVVLMTIPMNNIKHSNNFLNIFFNYKLNI
jgi:hypothetical protein